MKNEQILTEYKIRALKLHPDKNPNSETLEQFQRLQEARDILLDPELRRTYDKWRQSEMCIPFKTFLSMQNRCQTTMHWAKPKSQTMLEGPNKYDEIKEFCKTEAPQPPPLGARPKEDIQRSSSAQGWEHDNTSDVYKQFRNYKI